MKSDLTCPVEITGVEIRRENEQDAENGQIVCLIDFLNLAAREVSSIQMNGVMLMIVQMIRTR